jgi:hypothetical protein
MWEQGQGTQSKHNCERTMTGKTTMWEQGQRTQSKHNCERTMTGKTTMWEQGQRTKSKQKKYGQICKVEFPDQCRHIFDHNNWPV